MGTPGIEHVKSTASPTKVDARPPLTHRQRDVLAVIVAAVAHRGFPPSIREIARACGINPSTAFQYLTALEVKGYVRRVPHTRRAIQVVP